jgi:electron transfer flavoprotein alpha subunit
VTSSRYGPDEASGLWVHLEPDGDALAGVSRELLGRGRELARELGVPLTGLVAGHRVAGVAVEAVAHGADVVLVADDPRLDPFTVDPHAAVIETAVLRDRPDILLFGASAAGRDLAGRLAVRFRTGLTSDCTGLALEEGTGLLLGDVAGFGGGIMATIKCERHRPQMASVRPGVFVAGRGDYRRRGEIRPQAVSLDDSADRTRVLARAVGRRVDVTQAAHLVVVGGGTSGRLDGARELAAAIGAELGATRVAADAGWLSHEHMIGQTGSVVRPQLAILCGVSGAMQFTVGIQESETVVAINNDPDAPAFEVADYGIVGELETVLPALVAELRAALSAAETEVLA